MHVPRRSALSAAVLLPLLAACASGGEDAQAGEGANPDPERDIDRAVPYLELAGDSDGPVVELLLDFRCPPCKDFEEIHQDLLGALVEERSAVLRIHPRPMLDERRGSTFSQDAAAAAAAVYAQDPALLLPFEAAVFAAQAPSAEYPDPDLEQIAAIAAGIGADEAAMRQIQQRTFVAWTHEVVEAHASELEVGTPTVLIDDEVWEGDWTVPGALHEAIDAAR